jgi:hypothetical protein
MLKRPMQQANRVQNQRVEKTKGALTAGRCDRTALALVLALALSGCVIKKSERPPPPDADLIFWESVRSSADAREYQLYLKNFPSGRFAEIAALRVESLSKAALPAQESPAALSVPVPTAPLAQAKARAPAMNGQASSVPSPRAPENLVKAPPPTLPPPAMAQGSQQGEIAIIEAPAPPVGWAKIDPVKGAVPPAVRSQIMDCWTPPPLPRGSGSFRAEIAIYYKPGGEVRGAAFLGGNRDIASDRLFGDFVRTALDAPLNSLCRNLALPRVGAGDGGDGVFVIMFGLDSAP